MKSRNRRNFLSQLGGGITGGLLTPSLLSAQAETRAECNARAEKALRLRIEIAKAESQVKIPPQETNGDTERYPNHLANYSKGLRHNQYDIVDPLDFESLLKALRSGKWEDFEDIPLGGKAKQSNPLAAFAYTLEGVDPHNTWTAAPPAFSSNEEAGEAVELYWQSLTRDIKFADYDSDPLIKKACDDLTKYGPSSAPRVNGEVTPQTMFRAPLPGTSIGPYLSQFLLLDVPTDNAIVHQQYPCLGSGVDFMTQYDEFLAIEDGALPGPASPLSPARYTITARDLVTYVHKDFPFEADLSAALILGGFGGPALSKGNPYKKSKTQAPFVTYGQPMIIDWIGRATVAALKACWYHKWLVHLRIRPEEFGSRVHNTLTKKQAFPISSQLFASGVLDYVYKQQGTYLLAQAYPEGCPLHPSYPAGHGTIVGACVTVLKALFDENFEIPKPVVPSDAGDSLEPYTGEPLTVGNELNKLASNVAISRDAAGVHWRSDSVNGMLLGEWVAIRMMADLLSVMPDNQLPLTFHSFSGELVTIHPTVR
ncbi:MAG: vanadium-dependent haloperoxidase [Acidobacteriaceae bacterium]|nr:vanadium-dependent haloperoxidase [Acidobacteriaceae bacterium]MBV9779743.1 vanadium-dependent haloperoxidase [Acidobacteriaceae bacterium]